MQRLYTLTLAMFIIAMMSLSLAPVMAQEDGWVSSSVVINDDDDDPHNPFISGSAWIGNFSYSAPNDNNDNIASIYAEHAYYAHHYSTEDKVNYSLIFKIEVTESPNYRDEHGANGQMDEHDENNAMPHNYISSLTYTYADVTSLARLPGDKRYTATGYTRLSITNPDGDDLNVKSTGTWKFRR